MQLLNTLPQFRKEFLGCVNPQSGALAELHLLLTRNPQGSVLRLIDALLQSEDGVRLHNPADAYAALIRMMPMNIRVRREVNDYTSGFTEFGRRLLRQLHSERGTRRTSYSDFRLHGI